MVHGCRTPSNEAADMASITLRCSGNVIDRTGQGVGREVRPIMASRALAGRAGVIHLRRPERSEIAVAAIALRAGGNVGDGFTQGCAAVMASRAPAIGSGIVHKGCSGPTGSGFVAGVALCLGTYVGRRLGLGVLADIRTAVASGALAGHAGVVHHCRCPIDKAIGMAGVALVGGGDMRCRLGQGIGKIV